MSQLEGGIPTLSNTQLARIVGPANNERSLTQRIFRKRVTMEDLQGLADLRLSMALKQEGSDQRVDVPEERRDELRSLVFIDLKDMSPRQIRAEVGLVRVRNRVLEFMAQGEWQKAADLLKSAQDEWKKTRPVQQEEEDPMLGHVQANISDSLHTYMADVVDNLAAETFVTTAVAFHEVLGEHGLQIDKLEVDDGKKKAIVRPAAHTIEHDLVNYSNRGCIEKFQVLVAAGFDQAELLELSHASEIVGRRMIRHLQDHLRVPYNALSLVSQLGLDPVRVAVEAGVVEILATKLAEDTAIFKRHSTVPYTISSIASEMGLATTDIFAQRYVANLKDDQWTIVSDETLALAEHLGLDPEEIDRKAEAIRYPDKDTSDI